MRRRRAASKPEGKGGGGFKRRRTDPNPKKEDEDVKATKKGKSTAAEISKPEASTGAGVHPLLIPNVLEKVLQHIIVPKTAVNSSSSTLVSKTVQNLRLVCKQWKDTATRLFRRNRSPNLTFGNNWGPIPKSPNERMQNFLDVMQNSNLIPIQRYTLNASFFVNETQQLMKDFMRICGPGAVELNLYWGHSCTMKFTRRLFPDLNLMRLKTLEFKWILNTLFTKQAPTYEFATLLEVVLGAAETLKKFQFQFIFPPNDIHGGKWTQALAKRFGECIFNRIPKNVKILHLDMPLGDFHINTLAKTELKLEEFQFDSQYIESSNVIRNFFEKQTSTLKVLKIVDRLGLGFGRSPLSVPLDFPRFNELLHLELRGTTIQNVSFPDAFPKLTCLNMVEWLTESTCVELLNSTKKAMSLTEIHLPRGFSQAPLVKKVAQCFPNISKLHISSSQDISETLQEVFIYFDKIEELYINFPYFVDVDFILSGISRFDSIKIMKRHKIDNTFFRNFQYRPSILNLTKLKKLVLENPRYVTLTDFSVDFVFLKMASLNELHTNQCEISSKGVGRLREKLSLKLTGSYPLVGLMDAYADDTLSSNSDSD